MRELWLSPSSQRALMFLQRFQPKIYKIIKTLLGDSVTLLIFPQIVVMTVLKHILLGAERYIKKNVIFGDMHCHGVEWSTENLYESTRRKCLPILNV